MASEAYKVEECPKGEGSRDHPPPDVIVTQPNPAVRMLERVKARWSAINRDNKRMIIAIIAFTVLLSIIVITTISTSAGIKEVKSEAIWNDIRLPDNVKPTSYDVKLKIDMTNEMFSGHEYVYVNVSAPTAVILIHISSVTSEELGREMNITSYKIHEVSEKDSKVGSEVGIKHAFPFSLTDFFVMKLKKEIKAGSYRLTFEWESRLVAGLDGIYLSTYKDAKGDEKKVLASQLEPLAARKVIPCFDEPNFKAKFKMEITSEDAYPMVLWNMPQEGAAEGAPDNDGWSVRKFGESVPMSTYLLAFIVSDFKCTAILTTTTNVKVRTCGRPAAIDAGAGDYSNRINKDIIETYETFYGTKFPLPKIDSVAVPDFSAGAMENWGLILYRETALLYSPDTDTFGGKSRVNTVVAHELAHQWFGNLVTMKWWNDLWLNEGFASYVEWIGTDASEPAWNYNDFRTYSDRSRAFSIDAYMSSRPTSIAVEKPADITAQFDSISYSKGSALLLQAKMFMGGDASADFEVAIRNYIKKYSYGNTVQNDLYEELSEVYKKKAGVDTTVDITLVMKTWTLQMNFPVVSVKKYNDDKLIMSQSRFLISGPDVSDDKASPYGYQWYVPIEYSISGGGNVFKWLKPHSKLLVDYDSTETGIYIHVNKESAGYYITDYSYDLFNAIVEKIKATAAPIDNVLTTSERQGLLFDTFMLVSAGYKPMDQALALLNAVLAKESALVPLREISRQLSGVGAHIRENKELVDKWKLKWKGHAKSIFDTYGAAYFKSAGVETPLPNTDDEFQQRLLITFAVRLACAYEVEECRDVAMAKFSAYQTNEADNPLSVDFKDTILSVALLSEVDPIKQQEKWDFLWAKYLASEQQSEKQVLYYALGLVQNEEILKEFSKRCLDPAFVRSSDALYIMGRSIAQTYLGAQVSLQFMMENWDTLVESFKNGLFAVDAYISGVLSNFANDVDLKTIEDFFQSRLETLGSGRAAYESAIQNIKANIAWLKKHKESVETFVA